MTAVLKLFASGFIKLYFAWEMEAVHLMLKKRPGENEPVSLGGPYCSLSLLEGPLFPSYGCLWSIPNTTSKYGFLPSLNLGWETSLFRSNRCCAHYLLPSLYSFPNTFPFSVPRRILILFIFSLSSIQLYALRKAGPTLRPSPDYSKPIIVVLFAILGIGIDISI